MTHASLPRDVQEEKPPLGGFLHSGVAPLRVVDSITELGPQDAGCLAVSGSHGGTSSARFAMAARPALTVFNDAGGGKDAAGIAGLPMLQAQGLAACTVAHDSARIGDAHSTLADGIINHVNTNAAALGVAVGQRCQDAVAALQSNSRRHA